MNLKLIGAFFSLILAWPGLGWGTELASDDFNRADGGLGANWTTVTGDGNPQIVSNQVQPAVHAAGSTAIRTAETFADNQYATIKIVNIGDSGAMVGVNLRGITAANTLYQCQVFGPFGATAKLRIYRFNAGVQTSLADSGANQTVAANDILKCTVSGSTVKLYINDVEKLSVVDGTPITSGKPGVGLYTFTAPTTKSQLDDFAAGDLDSSNRGLLTIGVGQ